MKLDWTTLIIAYGAIGAAVIFLIKWSKDWKIVKLQESADKIRIAEATQFAVGTLSAFLVKVETQEKKLEDFKTKVTYDNQELGRIVDENAKILHDVHRDLSEYFLGIAINSTKK